MADRINLDAQIDGARLALDSARRNHADRIARKSMREIEAALIEARAGAALATLEWLKANEVKIREDVREARP